MENELSKKNRQDPHSISNLSLSLLADVKALLWKEFELVVLEVREQLQGSYRALIAIGLLAALAVFGLQLLVLSAALYAARLWNLDLYASFALTGSTLVILTMLGALFAILRLKKVQKNSFEATKSIKERWTGSKDDGFQERPVN